MSLAVLLATGGTLLNAPDNGDPNTEPPPVQPAPPKPRQPIRPVQLPKEIEDRIPSGPMPGTLEQMGPVMPQVPGQLDREPTAIVPAPTPTTPATTEPGEPGEPEAQPAFNHPGVQPTLVTPEALPLTPEGTEPTPGAAIKPAVPGGQGQPTFVQPPPTSPGATPATPGTGEPETQPDQPEVYAAVASSNSVRELLAQADRKLDAGVADDFTDADWQEFTTVIGGTPATAALADVPEEIYKEYVGAERDLRQAVWNQIFDRSDEAAQLADNARARYVRVGEQLPPGDGVYNVVQRVSWGARIRKKYIFNDVMLVPGERALMTENLNTLNREYRLYLVFKQQDPVKQRHNRVLLIGEIWRNMRDHQAPDRAMAAVHKSMTQMAEAIFEEDTRDQNPIGALIPSVNDTMELLAQRNRLLDQYMAMVNDYDLFDKKQRDRLGELGYVLKLETDARVIYDQRQTEFAEMKQAGRWKEIKSLSLTVTGERDKFSRTYAKENWIAFAKEIEDSLKAQSDAQLATHDEVLKTASEGEKLVELKTTVEKDTQIYGGIDAQNWDTLASNINIKIIEIKQSRGQRFLEGIRTETQNTTTKDGLDQIMEKLNARRNELVALNMVQEYESVQKDINDRINRFSQIGQAVQQQQFFGNEIARQKTSNELAALMGKIREDRNRFAAVLDIPKWDELQQKASLQLDLLLKQEFNQSLTALEQKAEQKRNDLLALNDMINQDLLKAAPEAKRWGLNDRFDKINDTIVSYQRAAQVAGIEGEIGRYMDELARAKNDGDINQVVSKFKSLEESCRSMPIPQPVKDHVRANKVEAEAWREAAKKSRIDIESAEAALRDGL